MAGKVPGRSDLVRLTRILGMLGSDHAGERASAALAAHRLVSRAGLDWWSLLGGDGDRRLGPMPRRGLVDPWSEFVRAAAARERQLRTENEELRRELAQWRAAPASLRTPARSCR